MRQSSDHQQSVAHDSDYSVIRSDSNEILCVRAHAQEVVPALAQEPIAKMWGGIMAFSRDGLPLVGWLPLQKHELVSRSMDSVSCTMSAC